MKKILQDFKGWFWRKWYRLDDPVYLCDPWRNRKCDKKACWIISKGPCQCTKKKKYAKRDENGKPVIATDEQIWNDAYMDYIIEQNPHLYTLKSYYEKSQKKQRL